MSNLRLAKPEASSVGFSKTDVLDESVETLPVLTWRERGDDCKLFAFRFGFVSFRDDEFKNLLKLFESKTVVAEEFPDASRERLLCCFLTPNDEVVRKEFSDI